MPDVEPLTPSEEQLWRAVMRIVISLPRLLEADLLRPTGLTANEYTTMMCLSEAPHRELGMAELAQATALSASRMTRLVDDLQARDLVGKRSGSDDARRNLAKLTPKGLAKLKSAYPVHLASVRRRFFDLVDIKDVPNAARLLSVVATHLEGGSRAAAQERTSATATRPDRAAKR